MNVVERLFDVVSYGLDLNKATLSGSVDFCIVRVWPLTVGDFFRRDRYSGCKARRWHLLVHSIPRSVWKGSHLFVLYLMSTHSISGQQLHLLKTKSKAIYVYVNGRPVEVRMKLGSAGEVQLLSFYLSSPHSCLIAAMC